MKGRLAIAGATLAAAALASALSAPTSAGTPARVIDRTFICKTTPHSGIRGIEVRSYPDHTADPPRYYLTVQNGFAGPAVAARDASLALAHTGGLRVHAKLCRAAPAARVPLRAGGLTGGATPLGEEWECELPGRVLVRVRATLARPDRWLRRTPTYAGVNAKVTSASVAVWSLALRKPIAFSSIDSKAGASVFVEPTRCLKD